jgi:hypothetical protein
MKKIVAAMIFLFSFTLVSQQFNVNAYKEFLLNNQNMSSSQLLQMHPAGVFNANINQNFSDALFFQKIDSIYNLTSYEKELLTKHGFVISERLKKISFGQAFLDIYHQDLPVFISTDAILHAFHHSYKNLLMVLEANYFHNNLVQMLTAANGALPQLHQKYSSYPAMQQMLYDVDFYITVGRKLLNGNASPYYSANQSRVTRYYNKAMTGEGISLDTMFANACVRNDWSQFKPRGHYVSTFFPHLQGYFRAMMWLGRIELYLIKPRAYSDIVCLIQSAEDERRQTITSMLLAELFSSNPTIIQKYHKSEELLTFFVGEPDNITIDNLLYMKNSLSLNNLNDLLDDTKYSQFQDSLKAQSFAYQKILSQILISDPLSPDSIIPASAFMLFGQRFIIDSYVMGSVVYDRIFYNNQKVCRLFPKTLDPMFALGNDAAAQLLIPDLNEFNYSSNLAALRYLIDSYDNSFWGSTIYNMWLRAIRSLNPPLERDSLPAFMRTAAFWQQKMNTQLSSWTQLRHDNLLYAKQSYTGGSICFYPHTYVEPFPEFYNSIKKFAVEAKTKFEQIEFDNYGILQYLPTLKGTMDTLSMVSVKILNNTPFTTNEIDFLHRVMYHQGIGSGPSYNGWYPKLYFLDFESGDKGLMEKDHIVADVHTTPTDCGGNMGGWVTHVGNGSLDLGVVVAELPGNQKAAFIGPFLTYYEYVTTNFLRLTDQEWENQYLQASLRPDWVNLYLADSIGNSRGEGPTLITSIVVDGETPVIPVTELVINNYPNPFNPTTIISFTVPATLTNNMAELKIYDINGKLITTLLRETVSSGNYLVKWDGTNSAGAAAASGVYFYSLKVGGKLANGKMLLMK